MKIYYDSSLWYTKEKSRKQVEECKSKQKINWEFEYLGQKHYIPYVYRFKKGIVFDIITPIGDEVFKAYIKKYEAVDFSDEAQRGEIEEVHPYQSIKLSKIWINGVKVEKGYSSSASLCSSIQDDEGMYKKFKKAYREILKDEIHFGVERCCIPYPKAAEGFQKFKRIKRGDVIKNLKFETREVERHYHLEKKFKLSSDKPTYEFEMEHPVTKEKYVLSFERGEEDRWQMEDLQCYVTSATYEITPPLKMGERLNIDSSINYSKKPRKKSAYEPESTCSASIGIIGGADGPTVMFLTGKAEKKECFSKITFEAQKEAEFELKEMYITETPRQIYEYERK